MLFELLAGVFISYLVHGSVTPQILSCAFLPLFKGGLKNLSKFGSYRAIAGASQIVARHLTNADLTNFLTNLKPRDFQQ